jgi:hypothetical protein
MLVPFAHECHTYIQQGIGAGHNVADACQVADMYDTVSTRKHTISGSSPYDNVLEESVMNGNIYIGA